MTTLDDATARAVQETAWTTQDEQTGWSRAACIIQDMARDQLILVRGLIALGEDDRVWWETRRLHNLAFAERFVWTHSPWD